MHGGQYEPARPPVLYAAVTIVGSVGVAGGLVAWSTVDGVRTAAVFVAVYLLLAIGRDQVRRLRARYTRGATLPPYTRPYT